MGTKQITVRFCDSCQKEIIGRLTLHTCPCCGKDICVSCQEKEDAKHKPRERKPKTEQVSAFSITQTIANKEPVLENIKKKVRKKMTEELEIADRKGDNLTIHVPTGLGDDTDYMVNIAGSEASAPESVGLRVVVLTALEEFGGKIPDELSEQEKATLQGILDT